MASIGRVLPGTSGNDSFVAPDGDSTIQGGLGTDLVSFGFRLLDATISYTGNQILVTGPSGRTLLSKVERFRFTDGLVDDADGNPLVDDLFYYAQNRDVWRAGIDADAHYAASGWREGRNPNAFFDAAYYLAQNPDVAAAGINPLQHYDAVGWREGRDPSSLFSTRGYLAQNPDVAAAGIDPLTHFLQSGAQEGRTAPASTRQIASNDFDYGFYLAQNPDVAANGIDPLTHFQAYGWREGRNPNAFFDTKGYLATYGDVAAAGVNPLDHYHASGWREGRIASPAFDGAAYLQANGDVAAAGLDPLYHYLMYGRQEGRAAPQKPLSDGDAGADTVAEGAAVGTRAGITLSWGGWVSPNLTYRLVSDSSNGGFAVDAATGLVTVADGSKLDYETAGSARAYAITVQAQDGGFTISRTLTVAVTDRNDNAPAITSGATATVAENSYTATVVYTATAQDADGTAPNNTLTYSLGGADAGLFTINPTTGAVTFKASPNYEAPADSGANNVYDITVTATDGGSPALSSAPRAVAITVTDVNDVAPVVTSGATATVAENSSTATVVYTAIATDPDGAAPNNTVRYSLGGVDAGLFTINPTTGVVTFKASPNYEAPADSGANNVYDITVTATDGGSPALSSAPKAVAITVTDVNDNAPAITSGATATAPENVSTATAVYTATSTDADGAAPNNTVRYSLGGADAGLFTINPTTGAVTFKASPNYEAPADQGGNNVYDVTVTATDGGNPALSSAAKAVAITVTDQNDVAPTFTSNANPSVSENSLLAVTLTSSDPDTVGGPPVYTITGGADAAKFQVVNGELLRYATAPDYEAPGSAAGSNIYAVQVTASDGVNSTTQSLTVTITDGNDNAPTITSGATATAFENTSTATILYTATAQDRDGTAPNNTVRYSLAGVDAGLFAINPTTGAVTFKASPNYEAPADGDANNVYDITVTATDGGNPTLTSTAKAVQITVTDVNDNTPAITSGAAASVPEGVATGTAVYTATATDADGTAPNNTVRYSLGGLDAALFTIDPTTGAVTFKASPDYEAPADTGTDNVYDVTVTATDGGNPALSSAPKAVAITVTDRNDNAPVITSGGATTTSENVSATTVVYTATATDADGTAPNNTVRYSLGGADAALFTIDPSTGAVRFKASPDHEAPADVGGNNVYDVTVRATDGGNPALFSADKAISITVTDVNDVPPTFTSNATPSVPENTRSVVTLASSDPDTVGTNPPTYTIVGGADAGKFQIVGNELQFVTAPDFEARGSAAGSTVYDVRVSASDGANQTDQSLTVTVTNVNEAPAGTDKTVTTLEDTAYTFVASDFGFTDPDDVPANTLQAVVITTLPTAATGTLMLGTTPVTAGQEIAASDIGGLRFEPATNANGNAEASFTFQVRDNGGTADGGQNLDGSPNTITVNVTPVNDAPAGTNKTISTPEDTSYTFATIDFGFSDANDDPANALAAVRISSLPASGDLRYDGTAITQSQVTAGFEVSKADIDAGRLTYLSPLNANGTDYARFTFQVRDDGGTADLGQDTDQSPDTITLDVTPVNDAPTLAATGTNPTYLSGGVDLFNGVTVTTGPSDESGQLIKSVTLTITNISGTGAERLTLQGTTLPLVNNASGSSNGVTARVAVSGTTATVTVSKADGLPVDTVASLVDTVTYSDVSGNPNHAPVTVTLKALQDNGGAPGNDTVTLNISSTVSYETPPTARADDLAATEKGGTANSTGGVDPSGNLVTGTGGNGEAADTDAQDPPSALRVVSAGTGATAGGGDAIVTSTGTAITGSHGTLSISSDGSYTYSVNQADAAVNALNPSQTLPDVFHYTIRDTSGFTSTAAVNVTIRGADDAPVIANLQGDTITYQENNNPTRLDQGTAVAVTDVDNTNFSGGTLTVTVTANGSQLAGQDQLSLLAGTGDGITQSGSTISYFGSAFATVSGAVTPQSVYTFNAAATPAAVQALIHDIAYSNNSENPSTVQRVVDYTLRDGAAGSASSTVTAFVNVNAANDAPMVNATGTTAYTENEAAKAIAPSLTISDFDSATLTGATVSITNYVAGEDSLSYALTPGITGAIFNGGVLRLTGTTTVANYEAALRTVKYSNSSDSPTTTDRTISFQVNDGAAANNLSAISNHTVTITAVNDAPVITSGGNATAARTATPVVNTTPSQVGQSYLTAGNSLVNGLGGTAGFGENVLVVDDDNFSAAIPITSVFGAQGLNFFGTSYTSLFVNNNGNLTFRSGASTFTPSQITPASTTPLIAPFFSDIDTRAGATTVTPGGNSRGTDRIYYDLDAVNGVFTATWDDVGRYNTDKSLVNAFQVQLISLGSGNFDIVYRYEAVNWTNPTNDTTQARAGYAAGNGVNAYELPQSGNATQLKALPTTPGNTGINGVWVFQAVNGTVGSSTVTATGTIGFTDADVGNTHTASTSLSSYVVSAGSVPSAATVSALANALSAQVTQDGSGSTAGTATWSFALANDAVTFLKAGETLATTYNLFVRDGGGAAGSTTVKVTITGVNDAPVAVADGSTSSPIAVTSGTASTYSLRDNDSDPDTALASLTAVKNSDGQHGTVVVNANGTFTYTATNGYTGLDTFTYHVNDGALDSNTVAVTVNVAAAAPVPLTAATGEVAAASPTADAHPLTQADLDGIVAAAIARWEATGATESQVAALRAVHYAVADLAGDRIGEHAPGVVTLDTDAAGHGWFIDLSPEDSFEFTFAESATDLRAAPDSPAAGLLDLTTAVLHEMGHVLGLDDQSGAGTAHDLMYASLADGERRLPDAADVATTYTVEALKAEAALPAADRASAGTPTVVGTAGADILDAGQGSVVLFGGAGADTFAFSPAALSAAAAAQGQPAHVADYHAAQGDLIDVSALGLDLSQVRLTEAADGHAAALEVQGAGNQAGAWIRVALLDGVGQGDEVDVLLDAAHPAQALQAVWHV